MEDIVEIKWLNAVIDLPADFYDQGEHFWAAVTNCSLGPINPEHPEYRHLLPASGNMVIELQRIDDGQPNVHLDLVVEDVKRASEIAEGHGASAVFEHPQGHRVHQTPGGVVFCVVPWGGEAQRPPSIDPNRTHAVDQVCLDVPHAAFARDVQFWAALTGWNVNPPAFPEFRSFAQPDHLPLRILVQQLGTDDQDGARAHLDISSGSCVDEVIDAHAHLGATHQETFEHWGSMVAPGGVRYCVTSRRPTVERLS